MDELEYITKNALMMCDQGGAPAFFTPTYNETVKIHGCLVATNKDAAPITNIPTFVVCKVLQGPCAPKTAPMTWQDTWQVKIKNINSLIGKSNCPCPVGGKIEFMTSGQIPLPADAAAEVTDMQEQAQRELDDSGHGSSIGEAGFAEGLIPVWGSGRDLINDIQTGDGWGAAMNAGFLIWDVASIAAGCVTFGAATVAMQGAKTGLKATIKAGGKVILESAMKGLGKAGFKKLTKESLKEMASKIACAVVKACFTGETLIHTKNGLKQIKDIKIGDKVYSYNEEDDYITIQKVTTLFEDEVVEILEIITENETIRTTRNHPFFVNNEWKDAEQIALGEYLFTKNENHIKVISLNYIPKTEKVYNFEVENDHCYFVGEEGVLVLNACYRKVFFEAYPHLKGIVSQVHHAIPKDVFKKWPDLFDKKLMNSLENLRGIPKEGAHALHQSAIHKEWNEFYKIYKDSGLKPTKEAVEAMAKKIDDTFGHLFNPPLK